jgi:gliding motility-associated-like protein
MKRALRALLSTGLPLLTLFLLFGETKAQCPVVIDSIVATDVTCNGALDGSICIYVTGGSPNYVYQIFNGVIFQSSGPQVATSFCFTGLGSVTTNYQIIVVGENGGGGSCQAAIGFATINVPPPFGVTVSTVPETCPDSNDGEASVVVTGGVAPYTYQWPPFISTNDTITGLDGGNYTVIITDDNGCEQTESFTINTTPDWAGTLTPTNPTCFGGADGSIASSGVSGGVPPYTFSWTGTAQTTENISGLTAGSYTLTATDFTGCIHVFPTVVLTQPAQLILTETHNNVSCDGQDDGSIDVAISGGVLPYTYTWSNGESTQDLNNLGAGNYLLSVEDANGCTGNLSITILNGSALSLSVFSVNAECNEANGSIDLTVAGGSGNYGYTWQPGSVTTQDLSGLTAGVYTVVVTDNTIGCLDTLDVIVNNFPGHDVTGVVTDGTNCVSNDGEIDITVNGGSGDFSYNWSHGPVTEDVAGLAAGNYTVTVTDNIVGCVSIATFSIQAQDQIVVSAAVTQPNCGSINGNINLTIGGGSGPYTFLWSDGSATEDLNTIPPGVYSVTITDVNGCTLDTSFSISNLGAATVVATVVDPTCSGVNNGSISLSVSGGVGPFSYNWSNGTTGASITGLSGATYSVIVTDQGTGCVTNESYTLIGPPPFVGYVNIQNLSCGGANDGFIEATVSGGTPPYTVLWTPGNFTSPNIYNLSAGSYTGVATDDNGCTISGVFTITSAPAIVISETHEDITCNGDNNGSIDISVVGGTAPVDYNWQPNGEITQDLSNLGVGVYEIFVSDAVGCTDSLEVIIAEPAVLVLNPTSTDASCNGLCDGTASVAPTGGAIPYTFDWSPNSNSGPSSVSICAGNYSVLVTDANGCSETAYFTIADNQIQYTLTTTDVSCNGSCDGSASVVVTGNNPPFTIDWQPTGGTGPSENGLCAGNYSVSITDATGCEVTETFTIIEPDPILITLAVTDVTCEGGSDGAIDLTVSGGAGPYTYQWYPLGQTTEDINNLPAGEYSVVVTDANGCTSSAITLGGSFNGGTLALPDGTGSSYNTTIPVNGFPSSATIQSAQDILGLCVNMEHSYLGDLDIQLTCPNGTVIDLVQSIGVSTAGSTFLGDAADSEADGIPGIGWDYCWSNNPTYGNMGAEATAGNTVPVTDGVALPSGSYTPVQPFSNLIGCPLNGNWTITVTDNYAIDDGFIFDWEIGFSGSGSNDSLATVNEPGPITISSNITDADCGSCNGAITVTPLTGTAPYTYLWNTGATTATIASLCAGVYNVEVTDANGCTENFFVPVSHVDGPTGSNTLITDASCYGSCDGEATVGGIGGTAPYTYQWVPGGYTTANVTGLCAGTYYVQIQDADNCIYTEEVVIAQPAQINIGQTIINSLCGQCTGAINLTPITGVAPYTYVWTQPGLSGTNPTGLCAGVYNVTVTDATGCSRVITSLINDIPSATLFMTGINPLCNDSCNGQAIATPVGGTPPFTYLWDDPSAQTDSVATGLCEGLYTVTLTDDNGCVAVNQVSLTQPAPIGLSLLIIDNGTCAGNCDGAITVIPSGGSIPFTYLWNDPLNQTTATAIDLCAGTYSVEVTDVNGCTDITTGTVNNPAGFTASATVTNATCNGVCDGSAYVTIVGGTAPFTYVWDNPTGQVTDTAVGLCAGSYSVTITDVNNCDFIVPVTIGEPAAIAITFSAVVNLQCDGICIGEATADVTGGTGPYTYLWNDASAQTTQTAVGLCASTYTVTVTDANGCVATQTITITGPNGLTSSITAQTNITCNGLCNGTATVTATGGTAPYTYQWNDLSNTTTPTVTGLCAGIYSVTVTDDNGCVSVSTVTITQPAVLTATTTANDVSCFGQCNATASVFVTGGTAPYTYQWNDPNNQTTVTATGLCAGTYVVTVTGTNGCTTTATETIFQPPTGISIDTVVTDATCGVCNGEIEVIPNGGVPPYTYLWGSGQTTATVTGLCPGVHTVDITDGAGCTRNFDIAVSNTGGPTGATLVTVDASCFGVCDGEASVTPIGGTPPYTYNWVPGGQTNSSVTGLCAGNYNVQISDSLGCIYTQLVTIAEPAQIVSNATSTQATCGQCNGEIVLTPSGGDGGPYTYVWTPNVSSTETASALCAGVYTVTITDASGCETIEVFALSNIDGPVVTSLSTDALCNGSCDGTASISINGGTPPFTILWDDPAASIDSTVTGLCAGTFNATITDANGCIFVAQVTIGEPDPISLSQILTTAATCSGACDGTATVIPSGGTLPYTYLWSSGGTSATETGLCAGTSNVTVTDANGCTQQATATISEPAAITFLTTTVDASCYGVCDGEATVVASGGTGAFTYLWNDPAATANDTVIALCAGTYTVVATDAAGCVDSTTVTINEPDSISITITPTSVSCFGDCDGTAIAVATGGTGSYTYQWNDPSSTANDTVIDLCPGIYGLVVTDSMGCTATSSTVIGEPLVLALLDSGINITCGGQCDGIAGVLVQGGTGPYTYAWDDANNSTTPFITSLCAGTYQVVVTDANGCADSTSVTITEPAVLVADVTTVVNPSCGGVCDGELTVTPTGGTPNYTILWLPGLESTPTISGLCAGSYTVIVVDASGCADTTTVNLTEPPILTAAISSVTQVLCAGDCSGEATVTPTGGTPPFTYSWNTNPVQTDSTVVGLCVGAWTVTITDDIGCTTTASTTINEDNALSATVPIFTNVSCNGAGDGTATAFANGGVGPYTYSWNDINFQNTQTAIGLVPGNYTVTVTDSQSPACVTQASVTITEPATLTLSATATGVTCGTDCDGVGTATPVGGTAPYVITWNNPGGNGQNLCVGTYTATVTDANGCTAQASATVNGPSAIVSNATSVAATCSNIANGSIDLSVVGGVPGYSYNWSPGGAQTQDLTGVVFGTYTVVITDASGCSITASYSIGTLVNINANAGEDATVCIGSPILLDGSGGGSYLWSPAATLSDSAVADPIATPFDTTTYYLTVTIGNCVDVDSVTISTYNNPPVDAGNNMLIPTGGSIGLNANGVVTGWTYSWEPAEFLDNASITNPTATPDGTTMFYVTVTDENGCTNTDSVLVEVTPGILFPDGISPNGDGINDFWVIDNIQLFEDAMVEVYNRWGQMLFQSAPGYPVPWDGRFKGEDLPVGTYYYVIYSNNFADPFTGPITIIR